MVRAATVIVLALLAASCRAGFPSLHDAPDGAPPALTAARDAAPERLLALRAETNAAALAASDAAPAVTTPPLPPLRLMAMLPARSAAQETGVIERTVVEARRRGRDVLVLAVGASGASAVGARAADAVAAAIRRRGVAATVEQRDDPRETDGRVELYLAP